MEQNLKQVSKQGVTSLIGEGTLVPVGDQRLFKIESLRVENSVLTPCKSSKIVGNQSNVVELIDLNLSFGATVPLSKQQNQQVYTDDGLVYKNAEELQVGDIVPVKTGVYKYEVDSLAYEFGRMSSMSTTLNALIMLSDFILKHEVSQSVSWIEGFLNGSKELSIVASDEQLGYCKILANTIATLYSSIGQLVSIKTEKMIISSDNSTLSFRPKDTDLYLDIDNLDVQLKWQGYPEMVNVKSNVNWFVEGKEVNRIVLTWQSCCDTVIPRQYGKYLYSQSKRLKNRCWKLPILSFLQGSNDLMLTQFLEAFVNFDEGEDVRKGLRFVTIEDKSQPYQGLGFNLLIKGFDSYVANGLVVEGQNKCNI